MILNVAQLLVGDVLLLEAGDIVPVDAVLIGTTSVWQSVLETFIHTQHVFAQLFKA